MNIDNIIREEIARLNETAGKNMPDTFFDRVVQKLGGTPTEEKRRFFRAWKRAENTDAKFNPLSTKWDKQVLGQTEYGNKGVKNYPDQETGLSATVNTLTKGIGANAYKNIVKKLKQDDITAEELVAEKSELDTWGTGGNLVASVLKPAQNSGTQKDDSYDTDWKSILNYLQFGLDIFGLVPIYGDIGDIINALIYVTRANVEDNDTYYLDAALSGIAIIPAFGSAVALPLKAMIKGMRELPGTSKILKTALKNIDDPKSWNSVFSAARQNNLIDQNTLRVLSTRMRDVNKQIISTTDKITKQFGLPNTMLRKPRQRLVGLLDAMAEGAAKERKIAANADKVTKLELPKWVATIVNAPVKLTKASILGPLKTLTGYRKVVGADTKAISKVAGDSFDSKFLFKGGFNRFINTAVPGSGVEKFREKLPSLLKKLDVDSYNSNMTPAQARVALNDLFNQYSKRSAKDRKNLIQDFEDWSKQTNLGDGVNAQDYISALRKTYISKQFGLDKLTRSNFIPTFKESFQRMKSSGGRALVENLNVFKILPRLLRDAPVLSNSENELVASIGDMIGNMAYKMWESTGLLTVLQSMDESSPDYEQQKEESKESTKEFIQIKEEVVETIKQIPDNEYDELTPEEQRILQEILVFD
jgi:hypothetical protein